MKYEIILKTDHTAVCGKTRVMARGSGYDKKGTLLGKVLMIILSQDELEQAYKDGLYAVAYIPSKGYQIRGECGVGSISRIAKRAGWNVDDIIKKGILIGWTISK